MAKVAVIGSGIAGLSAAFLLRQNHDITVFERQDRLGGHSRTVDVTYSSRRIAVDTGFIVFNERNYPNLSALFRYLDVPVQASNMSFALTANDGWLEWGAENFRAIFAQRRNLLRPKFLKLFAEVMRFNLTAVAVAARNPLLTVGELLEQMRLGPWFRDYYLLPLAGAIWSTPATRILDYPASSLIRFFDNHSLLSMRGQPQWLTVTGGARVYVDKLRALLGSCIKLGCGVVQVSRRATGIELVDGRATRHTFDEVVFACHADEALSLLCDPTEQEHAALLGFEYQPNIAVLHRDTTFMPKRKACWSSWVYDCGGSARTAKPSVTYWMNRLQNIDPKCPLFVTLNPGRAIKPDLVFDRFECFHPIMNRAAANAQAALQSLQGQKRTWFCGAHLGSGFHEDGLVSALQVSALLGCEAPWKVPNITLQQDHRTIPATKPTTLAASGVLAVQSTS